eukprot:297709-Amphidinium_carterae.1
MNIRHGIHKRFLCGCWFRNPPVVPVLVVAKTHHVPNIIAYSHRFETIFGTGGEKPSLGLADNLQGSAPHYSSNRQPASRFKRPCSMNSLAGMSCVRQRCWQHRVDTGMEYEEAHRSTEQKGQ